MDGGGIAIMLSVNQRLEVWKLIKLSKIRGYILNHAQKALVNISIKKCFKDIKYNNLLMFVKFEKI